jgi:protein TonB
MKADELFLRPIEGKADYGRYEVRKSLHTNYFLGLLVSVLIHSGILGSYYLHGYLFGDEHIPTVKVRIVRYSDLGPPPSIKQSFTPPAIAIASAARPSIGIPVPVPDAEVSPEQTIASQAELSAAPSNVIEEFGEGGGVEIISDISIEDDGEPGADEFVPFEKAPQVVHQVMPVYPEMAVRAGLEGVVWVKILVDREGKATKALVIKSTAEIFEQAALNAAMQFHFTPALMNQSPVKVWVSIPFRFQLNDARVPS